MKIERIWAMPNKHTFTIKPIAELLVEEIDEYYMERLWIDPFCGENSPANITNDLNSKINADYHMDAINFLKMFEDESVDGVLYDPPYSPRQVAECYKSVGMDTQKGIKTRATFWSEIKNEIARITKVNGKVICCGWNSMGIGITRRFVMTRILLVAHGGNHNDTIITVEIKEGLCLNFYYPSVKNVGELSKMLN